MISKNFINVIDFQAGTHGHFLEYVINTWIYGGPRLPSIFTSTGASHVIHTDPGYCRAQKIHCGHFTEYGLDLDVPEKIIRLVRRTIPGHWIHAINVMHRVGENTLDGNYSQLPKSLLGDPVGLRNHWYSVLTESCQDSELSWKWEDQNIFEFPMENLYNFYDFYFTLQQSAKYLDFKFSPDQELYQTWHEFVSKNQGLQIYLKSQKILEHAMGQKNLEFQTSVIEQAMINRMLSDLTDLFDGALFELATYPTQAQEIWQHIDHALKSFDCRF